MSSTVQSKQRRIKVKLSSDVMNRFKNATQKLEERMSQKAEDRLGMLNISVKEPSPFVAYTPAAVPQNQSIELEETERKSIHHVITRDSI